MIVVNLIDKAFMHGTVLHDLGLELAHLPAQLVHLGLELGRLSIRWPLRRLCSERLNLALDVHEIPLSLLLGIL